MSLSSRRKSSGKKPEQMDVMQATLRQTGIIFERQMIVMNPLYWFIPFYKHKELKALDDDFDKMHKFIMEAKS
jgi:hypothetical protein